MKKLLIASALVFAIALPAMADALISQGSNELGVSGFVDPMTEAGTRIDFDLRYAYFFWDRISLGMVGGFGDDDRVTNVRLGVTGEYNFDISDDYRPIIGTDFVPYVGVALCYQHADLMGDKAGAGVFTTEGGMKFFLSDTAAVTTSVLGSMATDDVYADKHDTTWWDIAIRVGMRFYF
ncbi:MAG: hypothetical protein IJT88_08805 [Kiritimatiellae bacterium]|nr:hypothetical protein [Kiritimatiellia bacterium]MBQ9345294.1 hypothetical protein [Kiritimatiellia bacterium]